MERDAGRKGGAGADQIVMIQAGDDRPAEAQHSGRAAEEA